MSKWVMEYSQYQAYLRSPEWREKRLTCINLAGGVCEVHWQDGAIRRTPNLDGNGHRCDRFATTAHHRTYERLGNELKEDLVACCWSCHRAIEQLLRPERWGNGDPEPLRDLVDRFMLNAIDHG